MQDKYSNSDLRKIQLIQLEIAKRFVDFCVQNDLLCYFCGGGCIGTVRHKGFIPWDDDLDFFMPRDDFNKLLLKWENNGDYYLTFPKENYVNHELCATIQDKRTTFIKPHQKNLDFIHGIGIDIFPLDGYPNSKVQRIIQLSWGIIFQLFCSQMIPQKHGRLLKVISCFLLRIVRNQNARYKIWKAAEKNMSRYKISDCKNITEICAGPHYMKNKYPKEIFASAVFLDFEDTKMPVPVGYDQYLRIAFGDYMKLPPEEKRVPQHDAVFIDPNMSYVNYKGIYYCNK